MGHRDGYRCAQPILPICKSLFRISRARARQGATQRSGVTAAGWPVGRAERVKQPKKRSLRVVNEHSEAVFNAVSPTRSRSETGSKHEAGQAAKALLSPGAPALNWRPVEQVPHGHQATEVSHRPG
ncbi:hypothetical protein D3880_03710 [Pseudomonas cavernae]|uniref:Uncharacterized protein n=1 Tax=Pseudomonas cavernae TaxID=2320867 RepID=A0A385YXW6_9PSED|nr:hypothetical protein D3880_03710 [Pseudomonas cavernae]